MDDQGANVTAIGTEGWRELRESRWEAKAAAPPKQFGGLGRAERQLPHRLKWALFRARLRLEDCLSRAYDVRHNVETAREEPLAECGVPAADVERGNTIYRVTWGSLIRKALRELRIDHTQYTFIDYGAGKGKAMLMASDYPFKRIIGLEYSEKLHAVASANCRTYRSAEQKCHTIEAVLVDVLDYEPPCGPIVCFMCNPFDDATMAAMFDRWRTRHGGRDRDLRIIYCNMRTIREKSSVLGRQTWLRQAAIGKQHVILAPHLAL
ncbi:MAG TPA: class I SAM-dependent methyltransferase [Alphaproteobacteria bacterium]|nr:class I SAM-dependent methyltransferase [Alphaproteobacteria bacterium]